jgi:hypothetical protein
VGSGGSVVQMRCGHEMRQREGAWRTRRQIGVGCHGAGMSGREGRTRTHARGGVPVGEGNGRVGRVSWMWVGCFGPARRNSIVFHLFKKISNGFKLIQSEDDILEFEKSE